MWVAAFGLTAKLDVNSKPVIVVKKKKFDHEHTAYCHNRFVPSDSELVMQVEHPITH